ncbi:hypothetical protein [Neobacillus vireti]|uniref:hypothetical protein n=1 Tax=Neobacillus vireti TaxID=220686 RepID=UPI002FFFE9BC
MIRSTEGGFKAGPQTNPILQDTSLTNNGLRVLFGVNATGLIEGCQFSFNKIGVQVILHLFFMPADWIGMESSLLSTVVIFPVVMSE